MLFRCFLYVDDTAVFCFAAWFCAAGRVHEVNGHAGTHLRCSRNPGNGCLAVLWLSQALHQVMHCVSVEECPRVFPTIVA